MKRQKKLNKGLLIGSLCLAACHNNVPKPTAAAEPVTDNNMPAAISYSIVNEYPHDAAAFTEGLEYKNGYLYEGTGQYGNSEIRQTDLITGKVILSKKMEQRYFGEGITILNGKIYQLTYKEGKGIIYDLKTLKEEGTFTINTEEGWGMTNNGHNLIFDDGTNKLHYIDAATFKEIKIINVTDENGPVNEINEPEMINGYIYANQWKRDIILKIDTATGHVVAKADLGNLRELAGIGHPTGKKNEPDVLNGIAYDPATNRIFITGKYWPKLFEIKLDN